MIEAANRPPGEIFEISEDGKNLLIKVKLSENSLKILQNLKQYQFSNVEKKGKYSNLKFSYCHSLKTIEVTINKFYYFHILNLKKYEVLIFSRTYQSNLQDYLALMGQLINGRLIRSDCKMVRYDVFSMTIEKQLYSLNSKFQCEFKRLYLKISPFYYRRNPYTRTKQCEQFFSVIIRTYKLDAKVDEASLIPTDQQFFKNHRISFIDDMYSNESFSKRFSNRFLIFYQAHSLFSGQMPLQNRYMKEFYMKCASKCSMGSMRLKKMSFHFLLPSIQKEKLMTKLGLYLYCADDQRTDREPLPFSIVNLEDKETILRYFRDKAICFNVELIPDGDSQKSGPLKDLQDAFMKHLLDTTPIGAQYPFLDVLSGNSKYVRVYNEIGFCWLLCSLSFLIDRLIYRNLSLKSSGQSSSSGHYKDTVMHLKLPPSQEFKLKKYAYSYCVEVKSAYNPVQHGVQVKEEDKPKFPHENTINRIIVQRKKVAKDQKDNPNQNLEFPSNTEQLKGMVIYINELLKKWNIFDCQSEINNFVPNYLNIVVDKNKERTEKNLFKSAGLWKQVIDGLSALVEVLARGFCTPDTTVVLHILRTYQDSRRAEELTKLEINQGEEVMLMTFKYMKITVGGWIELIPSCTFYFEMQRDQTFLYTDGEKREQIMIKSKKEQTEKIIKGYLKRVLKDKIEIPPLVCKL